MKLNFWRKKRTRFRTFRTDREHGFSIGLDMSWESYFVSIPATAGDGAHQDYFRISEGQFRTFKNDMRLALPFVEACRRGENSGLLISLNGQP